MKTLENSTRHNLDLSQIETGKSIRVDSLEMLSLPSYGWYKAECILSVDGVEKEISLKTNDASVYDHFNDDDNETVQDVFNDVIYANRGVLK